MRNRKDLPEMGKTEWERWLADPQDTAVILVGDRCYAHLDDGAIATFDYVEPKEIGVPNEH